MLAGAPAVLLLAALVAFAARHPGGARSAAHWAVYVIGIEVIALVLLAGYGAVYERVSSARARRLHPPPGQLIDVGGYRLHLYCSGSGGPTVILIYGMSGSYLDWYRVQPELAKSTRVCSYDRPGYGWSDPSPKPRVPSATAEELHTLLHTAGEKPPFILVGHSLGAFEARMYAHSYPDEVAGLVLVDGAHPDSQIAFRWRERLWMRFLQFTAPLGLPRWRKWCVQGPPEIAEEKAAFNCDSRVFAANYALRDAYPQAAEEVRNLGSLNDVPLVVISRDPNRPGANPPAEQRWARLQESFLGLSTNSRRVIATGSGHGVPVERPDVINTELRNFVKPSATR